MGMGSGSSGESALSGLSEYYQAPMPNIVNMYEKNLTRGGLLDMPSFNEMFNSWKKLGEREAGRQSAAITESFGSQGARYSSDLLAGQGRLRENLMDQLMNKASEYQLGLRQQQGAEVGALANLRYGASEAAMNRMFNDFLRRTSPPPIYATGVGQSAGYGLPPAVI